VVSRGRINDPIDGQTPLLLAVLLSRPLAVTTLLEMGADNSLVAAPDGKGHTPLHAAANAGNAEITQLLLEAGDDPDHVAADGFAPIHRASWGEGLGHTEVVELLLRHGVSVKQAAAANGKQPIELVRHNQATRERLQHELRRHKKEEL
jgi:ankyrin repeat protein